MDKLHGRLAADQKAGVQYTLAAPEDRTIGTYLAATEQVARAAAGL